jgi:hypothetical protein
MINTFGRLTNKRHDIDAELKELKQKIENVEEAQTELIMAEGDVPYAFLSSLLCLYLSAWGEVHHHEPTRCLFLSRDQ